jgi:DNA-directed RNA polymerase subunit alpha
MEALPLPNQAEVTHLEGNKYKVTLEPLYPGYGVTIGNTIRRVLLSSMPGAAVTAVKIKFVDHEFSTVPNVKEDVIQIILSLKQIRFMSISAEPARLKLKVKGERVVTAADIEETDQVQVMNKDQHIATLDNKNADFEMELVVEQGRGYVPVEARENPKLEVGMLSIDAIYTPIKSVYFDVSNVRVGQITNFDKLELTMETDGTIAGEEAMDIASHILVDHFAMMFAKTVLPSRFTVPDAQQESGGEPMTEEAVPVETLEEQNLDDLNLSNRAKNALVKNGITTIAKLQALSNDDIHNIAGLGEKTITEILTALGRK